MAKKRTGKCTPELTERICVLVAQNCSWTVIEKVLKGQVSKRTMMYWLDETSELYDPDFAGAVKLAKEKFDCGRTKSDQVKQSQFHHTKKVTRERMLIDIRSEGTKLLIPPPKMPPSNYTVRMIRKYADEFLDYKIPAGYTKDEMMMMCRQRIVELTKEVMVKTKEEISECAPNAQAVKNVLINCGPDDGRWNFGQDHLIDASDPLKKLLGEIAMIKAPVPCEENV